MVVLLTVIALAPPPPHVSCIDGHIVEKLSGCPPLPTHRPPGNPPIGGGIGGGLLGGLLGGIL